MAEHVAICKDVAILKMCGRRVRALVNWMSWDLVVSKLHKRGVILNEFLWDGMGTG